MYHLFLVHNHQSYTDRKHRTGCLGKGEKGSWGREWEKPGFGPVFTVAVWLGFSFLACKLNALCDRCPTCDSRGQNPYLRTAVSPVVSLLPVVLQLRAGVDGCPLKTERPRRHNLAKRLCWPSLKWTELCPILGLPSISNDSLKIVST